MNSHNSPSPDPNSDIHQIEEALAVQRAWLSNMLPPSPTVCPICRAARNQGFALCIACDDIRGRAGGVLADAVVPISYAPEKEQHYYNLIAYKASVPNELAQFRLGVLYVYFVINHLRCLERAAGGGFTHIATVPSTRRREGIHPLRDIADVIGSVPFLECTANEKYGNERRFYTDRFFVEPFPEGSSPRVLILEDLWVTGSRPQSLAHAVKKAGAESVVTVALGRRVNLSFGPSVPLLAQATSKPFDIEHCALED